MKKLSLFTFFLALCLSWGNAQVFNLTVSGTVTDINGGAAVPNHMVDIVLDSSNFLGFSYYNSVLTDANGYYSDVIVVPFNVSQGTGRTSTRDCTPAGVSTVTFTYTNSSSAVSNLDHQICTTPQGGCSAGYTATWIQGTTLVQFTDQSSPGNGTINSWLWSFGDGGTSTQQNPSHSYSALGFYVICLDITTTTGCTATYCDSMYVGPNTGIFCSSSLSGTVNPNGSVTFTASGSGSGSILGYSYDFGDGSPILNSTNANETHTYAVSGTYTACVDIIFTDSCMSRACATVTTTGALGCQAGFTWFPDTSGSFSIIVVNTSTGNGLSYLWTFGDGTSSTQAYPQHTYSGPGTYVVCVTVTSNNPNCTSTYCDSLIVVNKVAAPFTINVVSSATAVTPVQPSAMHVGLYPNPARDFVQVDVNLTEASPVMVTLMDLSGRTVASVNAGDLGSGKHGIRLQTQDLPAGLYLARVSAGNSQSTHKMMVAH